MSSASKRPNRPSTASRKLRRIGIQPDILAVRCKTPLRDDARRKISLFASVEQNCVIPCHDAPSIYKVPEVLENQGMLKSIAERLGLQRATPKWGKLEGHSRIILKIRGFDQNSSHRQACKSSPESYVSIYHALLHATGISKKVDVYWIDSEKFENGGQQNLSMLKNFEGILVLADLEEGE